MAAEQYSAAFDEARAFWGAVDLQCIMSTSFNANVRDGRNQHWPECNEDEWPKTQARFVEWLAWASWGQCRR